MEPGIPPGSAGGKHDPAIAKGTNQMLMFKWTDGTEHDFDALPTTSRQALVNRAVSHVTGNEVASSVVAWIRGEIAGTDRKAESVTKDEVQKFRADNGAAIDAKVAEFQAAKLKAIIDGTLGVRAPGSGPRQVDPVAREIRKIAETEVGILLSAVRDESTGKPMVLPRGDAVLTLGNVSLDRNGWIERYLGGNDTLGSFGPKGEPNEPRIRKAAERIVAAAKTKAAKAAEVAANSGGVAEALGL